MAYDGDGFWEEDGDPLQYADYENSDGSMNTYEDRKPDEPAWDPNNKVPTQGPGSAGQPGVAFYGNGPGQEVLGNLGQQGIPYQIMQNGAAGASGVPPVPGATVPTPPNTRGSTSTASKPGASGGSSYHAPAFQPSAFILPNGGIPPGMPFSPDPAAVAQQNAALAQAMTPAISHFENPFQGAQNNLINKFLTQDAFGPDYINSLNEQQKEIYLNREQQGKHQLQQRHANRGTMAGGGMQAGLRRLGQDTTAGITQSHRDINIQTQQANRSAYEQALGLSNQVAGADADRQFREQSGNRASLLDALGMSENIYGGREDRGANVARMVESIRQYDQDLLNRQAEFGSGMDFNYDSLDASNERSWLDYLARLGGR